jgi:hypothetical protein
MAAAFISAFAGRRLTWRAMSGTPRCGAPQAQPRRSGRSEAESEAENPPRISAPLRS